MGSGEDCITKVIMNLLDHLPNRSVLGVTSQYYLGVEIVWGMSPMSPLQL